MATASARGAACVAISTVKGCPPTGRVANHLKKALDTTVPRPYLPTYALDKGLMHTLGGGAAFLVDAFGGGAAFLAAGASFLLALD